MPTSATGRKARRAERIAAAARGRRRTFGSARGFTLIEIMAVVLIMGLMMSIVLPNLSGVRGALLRDEALRLASTIELARQRAVMTGKPHRVWIDLEEAVYLVEWWVSEGEALGQPTPYVPVSYDKEALDALSLSPNVAGDVAYRPIPNHFGNPTVLDRSLHFHGIETEEGLFADGEVVLVFDQDGTTDPAEVVIANDYDGRLYLSVAPLVEHVRIFDEPAQ